VSPATAEHGAEQVADLLSSYDKLAPFIRTYSETRRAYLGAVDRLILDSVNRPLHSWLDVGSGDGMRAAHLAAAAGARRLVLSDPSEGMAALCREQAAEVWRVSAEELPDGESFDVITCLWNVLGLLARPEIRLHALKRMRGLLSKGGQLFLDVNNRYNISAYGPRATVGRMLQDLLSPSESNGDVSFTWRFGEIEIASTGHVFRTKEAKDLFAAAGLEVRKFEVVDYAKGSRCRSRFGGQLVFELGRGC
jgi:SAM-dependent methyltransferase